MDLQAVELATSSDPIPSRIPGTPDTAPAGASEFAFELAMQKVQELTEKLVSSTFLVPMLDRMQDDPFRSDMFHGGFAENVFQSHLNTQLADGIAHAMDLSFTRQITERFAERIAADPQRINQIANQRIDTIG